MAFLKSQRNLPSLILCGNPLPWTDKCKHLGTTLTNKIDGCEEDMKVKNAMYVEKNIELNQEFFFAHIILGQCMLYTSLNVIYFIYTLYNLQSPPKIKISRLKTVLGYI